MNSKKYMILVLVVAMSLCLAACSGGKNAATTAIKAAEDAYNAAKTELVQYVPDDAKTVEDAITAAKASFEKKDYAAALEAVKTVPDKIKELNALAATKKDEMTKGWGELSGAIPGMLETIKTKLDALSAARRLPANLNKELLEGAKSGFETATTTWAEAQADLTAGDLPTAMAKAKTVQEKAAELMTALGIEPATK